MRKTLFIIFLISTCFISNADVQIGDFNYNLNTSDMTAEVTYYFSVNTSTSVIIPSSIIYDGNEYTVTSIGEKAFCNHRFITSVEINNNITSIGERAFENCENLTDLYLTNSLLYIDSSSFHGCRNLKNITFTINDLYSYIETGWSFWKKVLSSLPNSEICEIDYKYNNESIRNLTIPLGVSKIPSYAFYNGAKIINIAFPDGFKEIETQAFQGTAITTVQFPESLESIGVAAFKNCKSLYSFTLPENIKKIEKKAFEGCSALYEVMIPENITHLSENIFKDCSDLEIIQFPSGLIEIGNGAFYGCRLSVVNLPESVEIIGDGAFYANPLKKFQFSSNLKSIGNLAFYDSGIVFNKLSFNEGLISIGSGAFGGSYDSKKYTYPLAGNIKKISLPSTLEFIGSNAFAGSSFTEVTIPASMTKITDGAFSNCKNLRNVTFHDNVTEIGKDAFSYTDIINISLPQKLTSIGANAFAGVLDLVSVTVPNSVTYIGENAFSRLNYLKLGTGFNNFSIKFCSSTRVLELIETTPPALTAERLWFEPQMVLVPEGAGDAYKANTRWKDYNITAKNSGRVEVYLTEPGTLATEIRLQSGLMPGAVTNLSVEGPLNNDDFAVMRSNMNACYEFDLSKAKITEIPSGAFKNKISILELALPNSIEHIGEEAFYGCCLMHTNIPESLITIGDYAFNCCVRMDNEIIFPQTISNIGRGAFHSCNNIKSVDMSLVNDISLDSNVFNYCKGLSSVILPSELTSIPDRAFSGSNIIYIEIPSTASIGSRAFADCRSLQEVVFKPGISTIGEYAFSNSGLTYVSIPSSIKSIPSKCFQGSDIVYANLEGVTEIATNAFADCPSLLVINLPATLKSVSNGALNSASMTAINSPSVNPAVTYGNPVADVSRTECALSIPKPSFSSYLAAEYWGGFVNIRNCIDITEESIDASGNIIPSDEDTGIELTYMAEEDYQEMLEDMEQEEENVEQPKNARRNALRIMRANGLADINKGYGKLFNNASLFLDENASTRFFISLADDVTSFSVTYNGKDITNQVDLNTMSFVIDGLMSNGKLIISTNGHVNGIRDVIADKNIEDESGPYYNLNGQIVKNPTPGIYIRNGNKVIIK